MIQFQKVSLFLFCLGLGLRFSGGAIPFLSPILIVCIGLGIQVLNKGNKAFRSHGQNDISFLILLVFITYALFTLLFTFSSSYGTYKIFLVVFWLLAFGLMSNTILANFRLFLLYSLFALVVVLVLFYIYFGSPLQLINQVSTFFRLGDDESNPISFSRFLGLGVLVSIILLIEEEIPRYIFLAVPLIILLALVYMFLSGSKGPLFSLILSLLFYYFANRKFTYKSVLFLLGVTLVIFLVTTYFSSIATPIQDFINYRFVDASDSYTARENRIFFALDNLNLNDFNGFFNFIVGSGSGNFSFIYNGQDVASYPHNIFVEILYEYGVIGLMLFLFAIILPPIRLFFKNRKYPSVIDRTIIVFWFYSFLNAMVSNDISGNFLVFGFSLLTINQLISHKYKSLKLSKL